jgi:hypothetical protein
MLKKTSMTRLMTLSHAPPLKPAPSPRAPPASIETPMETRATDSEIREP